MEEVDSDDGIKTGFPKESRNAADSEDEGKSDVDDFIADNAEIAESNPLILLSMLKILLIGDTGISVETFCLSLIGTKLSLRS